tara:strand:- start:613 stop:858 length:246 start_codon:yes stop_codon:yes gene_type:complete
LWRLQIATSRGGFKIFRNLHQSRCAKRGGRGWRLDVAPNAEPVDAVEPNADGVTIAEAAAAPNPPNPDADRGGGAKVRAHE